MYVYTHTYIKLIKLDVDLKYKTLSIEEIFFFLALRINKVFYHASYRKILIKSNVFFFFHSLRDKVYLSFPQGQNLS